MLTSRWVDLSRLQVFIVKLTKAIIWIYIANFNLFQEENHPKMLFLPAQLVASVDLILVALLTMSLHF